MANSGSGKEFFRITYFDSFRGRAESIRALLKLAGVEYEEKSVTFEQWPDEKQKMPLGQLPVVETEKGQIVQATAIANFIANKYGFQPDCIWERAISDSILISVNDMITEYDLNIWFYRKQLKEWPGDEEFEKLKTKTIDYINRILNYVESKSTSGTKFIFGDKILVADVMLYTTLEFCLPEYKELRERSAWMRRWISNMEKDEQFAEYLNKRPETKWD